MNWSHVHFNLSGQTDHFVSWNVLKWFPCLRTLARRYQSALRAEINCKESSSWGVPPLCLCLCLLWQYTHKWAVASTTAESRSRLWIGIIRPSDVCQGLCNNWSGLDNWSWMVSIIDLIFSYSWYRLLSNNLTNISVFWQSIQVALTTNFRDCLTIEILWRVDVCCLYKYYSFNC